MNVLETIRDQLDLPLQLLDGRPFGKLDALGFTVGVTPECERVKRVVCVCERERESSLLSKI
jgi:hypothetical protein